MGCDIHAHIEIQIDDDWLYYAPAKISRNYDIFAKMAGVRNYSSITPVGEPRGLPDNISQITRLHHADRGGHSESWLSHGELVAIIAWERDLLAENRLEHRDEDRFRYGGLLGVYLFGEGLERWVKNRTGYPKEIEDIRLVFWFDS